MNTKGIKFLAVLAVLAMAFAAIAIVSVSNDSDAAVAPSSKWTASGAQGPLDFSATLNPDAYGDYSNATVLKSNILVSYDESTYTYKVTGTLYQQSLTATESAFYKMWPSNTSYKYGIGYTFKATEAGTMVLSGGEYGGSAVLEANQVEDILTYVKEKGVRYLTFTPTDTTHSAIKYTIDFTGVTLSDTAASAVAAGYVALANANALAGLAADASGTDGSTGTWAYDATNNKLTLTGYKGFEVFENPKAATKLTVVLSGTNSITAKAFKNETWGILARNSGVDTALDITATAAASLTIDMSLADSYSAASRTVGGIRAAATLIDGASADAKITITSNGPYAGIYTGASALTVDCADLTLTSGEKSLNTSGIVMTKSKVIAKMGEDFFNKEGDDKRFGVRTQTTIDMDVDSEIITQGLLVEGNQTQAALLGKITVTGDYEQSANNFIAGFQYKGATKLEAYTGISATAGKIVVDSANNVKGYVEVIGTSGDEKEIIDQEASAEATATKIIEEITDSTKADIIDAYITTQNVTLDVTIPAEKTLIMHVTSGGTAKVSGTVKFADDTKNAITLNNVTGTFKIVKGSIYIDDAEITAGSFTLAEGADAKINGSMTGAFEINVADDKNATLTIVEGKEFVVGAGTLTLGKGISFNIEGSLKGTAMATSIVDSQCTINVKDGGYVEKITFTDVATKTTTVNALTGSELKTVKVNFDTTGSKFIAMTGSDINALDGESTWAYITGKDAASGEWTYTAGNTLNLNNYNGTYNFASFKLTLEKIMLTGENTITYDFEAGDYDDAADLTGFGSLAGSITDITTATEGSLAIDIDISEIPKDKLFQAHTLTVISGAAVDINGVALTVNVTGQNSSWTTDETGAMQVVGIKSTSFKTYNATLTVDVLSSYTSAAAGNVIGVSATGKITIGTMGFSVASAGTAVKTTDATEGDAVTVTGVLAVGMDGKKAGLVTTNKSVTISSTALMGISGGISIGTGTLTVQETILGVMGKSTIGNIVEKNVSDVEFKGSVKIGGTVSLTQKSVLEIKDGEIVGAITNGGTIITNGNVVLKGDSSLVGNDENSSWVNNGTLGLFGKYANKGEFVNNGTFQVFNDMVAFVGAPQIQIGTGADDKPTDATKARIGTVTIQDSITLNADGTAKLKATLTPQYKDGDTFVAVDLNKFEGTLTPSQTDGCFILTMSNGSATFTITYNGKNNTVGEGFIITVSGALKDADGKLRYMDTNSTGATAKAVTHDTFDALMSPSGAAFTATAGKVTNTETFIMYSPASSAIATEYNGNISVYAATKFDINGKFTGNVFVFGDASTVELKSGKTMVGDIFAEGKVTIAGTLNGNVFAENDVTVTKVLNGNVTINANDKKFTVTAGKIDGTLTYHSKYKADKDAKEGEETIYTATMDVSGEGTFVINLAAGADATASTPVIPGFFTLGAMTALADKYVEIKLTSGDLKAPVDVTVPERYTIIIEKDTTIEVAKTAKMDVKSAALKVSKDATANFETGSGIAVEYGKVVYIMTFEIEDGAYTIYSDVAYALTNCAEGTELTLGSDAPINANVTLKAGVNIIVDGVKLDFKTYGLEMGEGAKITLKGAGNLAFDVTGWKEGTDTGDLNEYYTINGTFVFDEGNVIVMENVRFKEASTIAGVAATSTAESKFSVKFVYEAGTIALYDGNATGTIKLDNNEYTMVKGSDEKTPVTSVFAVCEDTVFEAADIQDKAGKYDATGDYLAMEIAPTIVDVDGVLVLAKDTTVKGVYTGEGYTVLGVGKKLTIEKSNFFDAPAGEAYDKYYGASFSGTIIDSTEYENGYSLAFVMAHNEAGDDIIVTAVPATTAVPAYVKIAGEMVFGGIVATEGTIAKLDGFTIMDDAAFSAEDTEIIKASKVDGTLTTKTIKMAPTTGFAALDYDATYEIGEYTVYTVFENIDFDDVSDIYIADTVFLDGKLDLSGKDVNITIAEGMALVVEKYLIIGTPATVLGDEGSSISGKVVVSGDDYLVAYADVDLSEAEIVSLHAGPEYVDAVVSKLDVEGTVYAYIFGDEDGIITLAKADSIIVPEIVGYNFTAWLNYNGNANAGIGETNAYADAKAVLVTVMVKYVAGVDYYMNGILFNVYDIPTDVPFGSYFTAKISDTTKYQGNPLINGQKTVCVDDDMELVASGVTPIPEPEPEPVIGDSGLSLTDILLIVLVVLIAIMVVILVLRLNRS